jgi:hypothetical protein
VPDPCCFLLYQINFFLSKFHFSFRFSAHFICNYLTTFFPTVIKNEMRTEKKIVSFFNVLYKLCICDKTCFIPETNKRQTQNKNECTPSLPTHKNKTIYICRFQLLLSCIHRVPTHPLLLKIRGEQPKM